MTTVVAVAHNGSVHMAADTVNNVYDRPIIDGAQKIARLKVGAIGEALIAASGAGAIAQLVRTKQRRGHRDRRARRAAARRHATAPSGLARSRYRMPTRPLLSAADPSRDARSLAGGVGGPPPPRRPGRTGGFCPAACVRVWSFSHHRTRRIRGTAFRRRSEHIPWQATAQSRRIRSAAPVVTRPFR